MSESDGERSGLTPTEVELWQDFLDRLSPTGRFHLAQALEHVDDGDAAAPHRRDGAIDVQVMLAD